MTFPLTSAFHQDYSLFAGAHHRSSLKARMQGGQPPPSGFFTSVISRLPFLGGPCGREKSLPVLARSFNPHVSAHPFESGGADYLNRLARSIT